jgi:hypothetical protein
MTNPIKQTRASMDAMDVPHSRHLRDEFMEMTDRDFVDSWPGMVILAMLGPDNEWLEGGRGLARCLCEVRRRYAQIPLGPRPRRYAMGDAFETGDRYGQAAAKGVSKDPTVRRDASTFG